MRWVPVVALLLTSFLHAATAFSTSRGPGGKRDLGSRNTISYVNNGPALTFHYTTDQPAYDNWIGVWKADDATWQEEVERDRHSSVAWHFARGIEGVVHMRIAASSAGMAAGKYKAYLFSSSQGNVDKAPAGEASSRRPLAGPEEFELAAAGGDVDDDECRHLGSPTYCAATNTCIAADAACDGKCAGDKQACNNRCIPSGAVCCAHGRKECFGECISDDDFCHGGAFGICPAAKPSIWEGGVCCNGGSDGSQGGQNCSPQMLPCNPKLGKECFGKCISKHDFCHGDAFGVCPAAKPSIWQGGVCCNGGSDGTQGGQNCTPQIPPCNPKSGKECSGKCISTDAMC